jgi:protein-disulfide isomerase/uncharacterized membrane protein
VSGALLNRISLVLAFAGIFIAGFLSLGSILNVSIPCGGSGGCDAIATHPLSKWFGLPVAYYGLAGYLLLTVLAVMRGMNSDMRLRWVGLWISAAGALVSFFLIYISLFVIQQTCPWCVASAITMTLLFITHGLLVQAESPTAGGSVDRILPAILGLSVLVGLVGFGMDLNKRKGFGAEVIDAAREMKIEDLLQDNPHTMGSDDAPIVAVEFADFTCPHCRTSYMQLKEILQQNEGKIQVVYRHFPLYTSRDHQIGLPAALISEVVAEKGKFWEFVELVFATEEDLTMDMLLGMAESLGFDRNEVRRRITDAEDPVLTRVSKDIELASKLGINLTPAIYIGKRGDRIYPETINTYQNRLNSPEFRSILRGQ